MALVEASLTHPSPMAPTTADLERVVAACLELLETRFSAKPDCGALPYSWVMVQLSLVRVPTFTTPARPFVTRRSQVLPRSVSINPSWLRSCRQSDTGVVGPIMATVGTPALRCVDGNSQEVSQNRGWKVSGEGQERDILGRAYVDASFCEREAQRGGGEMAPGALASENPRVVVVEPGWCDLQELAQ